MGPGDWTDAQLLAAIRRGEAAAWEALVDRYHRPALLLARRRLGGNLSLAEEAVQSAWVQVVQFLQQGGTPDHFGRFFTRVVLRRCADLARRAGRHPQVSLDQVPEGGTPLLDRLAGGEDGPLDHLLRDEEAEAVRAALARLNPRDRAVLWARIAGDLSNRDAARWLVDQGLVEPGGNLEKRVENYFYRALDRLARELAQVQAGPDRDRQGAPVQEAGGAGHSPAAAPHREPGGAAPPGGGPGPAAARR